MAQMQTLSIRIPNDDFEWLLSLPEAGAKTPSDRLRALIQRVRQQDAGLSDHALCAAWMRALAQPFADAVAASERQSHARSEALAVLIERVPPLMALLAATRLDAERQADAALAAEAVLVPEALRLLAGLLRAALTPNSAVYDIAVLDRGLPDIIELAGLIANRKERKPENG